MPFVISKNFLKFVSPRLAKKESHAFSALILFSEKYIKVLKSLNFFYLRY